MAKEKAVYEVVDGFVDLVKKLVDLNDDKFSHIEPSVMRMTMITNKEPPLKPPYFKIIRVNNPVAQFCPFRYIIVTWQQIWESFEIDQKGLMLLDILHYLEPDEDEPKLVAPDVKDHYEMLRKFGVDYLNNPTIKGIFDRPIDWEDCIVPDFGKSSTPSIPGHKTRTPKPPASPPIENFGEDTSAFDEITGFDPDAVDDTIEPGDEWKLGPQEDNYD